VSVAAGVSVWAGATVDPAVVPSGGLVAGGAFVEATAGGEGDAVGAIVGATAFTGWAVGLATVSADGAQPASTNPAIMTMPANLIDPILIAFSQPAAYRLITTTADGRPQTPAILTY
jgi:hypothetical protein